MSNGVSVSITPETEQAFLDAAAPKEPVVAPEAVPEPDVKPPAADAKVETLEIPEKSADAVDQLDLAPFYQEYADTGALSDESRTTIKSRLEKAGFVNADALIDQHMVGAKASVETARQAIFSHVGGETAYGEMVNWASKALSQEDIGAFNEAVKDPKMVKLAVSGLQAQFKAAGNQVPAVSQTKRVQPQSNVSSAFEPIRSDEQVAALVSDKRYSTDPGFKQVVDQRIVSSMKSGYLK
jgi:hypothetical protein